MIYCVSSPFTINGTSTATMTVVFNMENGAVLLFSMKSMREAPGEPTHLESAILVDTPELIDSSYQETVAGMAQGDIVFIATKICTNFMQQVAREIGATQSKDKPEVGVFDSTLECADYFLTVVKAQQPRGAGFLHDSMRLVISKIYALDLSKENTPLNAIGGW